MAFASAASKLSARLQENLSEAARDFGLNNGLSDLSTATSSTSTSRHLEAGALSSDDAARETNRLLQSTRDRDKSEGVRRVLALQMKQRPVGHYFASITACLGPGSSLSLRELVAVYILNEADGKNNELALMSVNMFQKDLNDPNPAIRALALRVLTQLKMEEINGLVVMSLRRASRDINWHVRRTVAYSLPVLYQQDQAQLGALIPILQTLLQDRSPLVVGSACAAFDHLCPSHYVIIHPAYRHICASLVDSDEWGQLAILRTLSRYIRLHFADPASTPTEPLNKDILRFLSAAEMSLQSRNPALTMAVVRVIFNLAPPSYHPKTVFPLLRLLHASPEIQQVALHDIVLLAQSKPRLFTSHMTDFFVKSVDHAAVKRLKVLVLSHLVSSDNVHTILSELQLYARELDAAFVKESIKAIGACAQRQAQVTSDCLAVLLGFLSSTTESTVAQTVQVLRTLLPQLEHQSERLKTISTLVQYLTAGKIQSSQARADVYWLAGQFAEEGPLTTFAPDVLRCAAKAFPTESRHSKLEIINLAAKLLVLANQSSDASHLLRPLTLLFEYSVTLARYDLDYPIRDRARFLRGLMTGAGLLSDSTSMDMISFNRGEAVEKPEDAHFFNGPQVKVLLFEASDNQTQSLQSNLDHDEFGSLSLVTGKPVFNPATLPPWTTTPSDPALRAPEKSSQDTSAAGSAAPSPSSSTAGPMTGFGSDSTKRTASSSAAGPGMMSYTTARGTSSMGQPKKPARDLQRFLAESEEEEEESDSEESESEETESESSEEDSESESEEDQERDTRRQE